MSRSEGDGKQIGVIMKDTLGYWKQKYYECEQAYLACQDHNKRDYKNAMRFAKRKVEQIERQVLRKVCAE